MKVTISYDVCMDVDLPVEVVKELYNAFLNLNRLPRSVSNAIMATPEWQALAKLDAEFELTGIYNPDYDEEGNEMPETELLWEE